MRIIIIILTLIVSSIYFLENNLLKELKDKIFKEFSVSNFKMFEIIKNEVILHSLNFTNLQNLSEEQLKTELAIHKNKSLLDIDINLISENLIKMAEIESVVVEKKFPNILEIKIKETKPFALWSYKKNTHVISKDGKILNFGNLRNFELPVIKGLKANLNAKNLIEIINEYEYLNKRLISADFISEYRWNVLFKDNILVKLPYKNLKKSIKLLNKVLKNNLNNLNQKKLIDLRVQGRIFFK